jgi:hypothetical protein
VSKPQTTTHTKGPWGRNIPPASKYNTIYAGNAPNHVHVCHLSTSGLSNEEIEGNYNLITAAPQLLALLKRINEVFYVSGKRKDMIEVMSETKPLIRMAEGRQ